MGKTFRIATVLGVPILVHWSLGLFFLFFIYVANKEALALSEVAWSILFFISLFLCVVLHEIGHVATAKKYGVKTRDIILSPIGGLARLESIPQKALQEFWIAINGPFVNLSIAGLLAIILLVFRIPFIPQLQYPVIIDGPILFLQLLMLINIVVFFFNLIPAFPMDGGRVLRSILALKFDRVKATFIASVIGKIIAIGLLAYAIISSQILLGFVAVFIYFMAGTEYQQTKTSEKLSNTLIIDIIVKNQIAKVYLQDKFAEIKNEHTNTNNFLVFNESENLVGTLPNWFLKEALKSPEKYTQVEDLYSKKYSSIPETYSMKKAFDIMQKEGMAILAVMNIDGDIVSSLDREAVSKLVK